MPYEVSGCALGRVINFIRLYLFRTEYSVHLCTIQYAVHLNMTLLWSYKIWIACHNMTCYVENLTLTTVESQKSVVLSNKETREPCTAQPRIPARQLSSRSIRTERQHMFGGNVYYDNTVPSH